MQEDFNLYMRNGRDPLFTSIVCLNDCDCDRNSSLIVPQQVCFALFVSFFNDASLRHRWDVECATEFQGSGCRL